MKDYYYIKFKPIKYDDETYYLSRAEAQRLSPEELMIFDSIDKAIDYKRNKLSDEAYQKTYLFEYYEMSIERF